MPALKNKPSYILWFKEIDKNSLPLAGGKGANLGEMTQFGIPVPPGFVVTTKAYFYFLEKNHLKEKIREYLKLIRPQKPETYQEAAEKIQKLIRRAPVPQDLALEIMKAYNKLGRGIKDPLVAVRSSATAEDLPDASFAGQQETFLNVQGETAVINKVRCCWASLFNARAIFYRAEHKLDDLQVGIAVPVQKMVKAQVSGVIFTADPTNQQKNLIIIDAVWGLGELIVQGEVIPDHYLVNRQTLKIISRTTNPQRIRLIKKGKVNKKTLVPNYLVKKPKLTDREIIKLARIAKKIHQHYFFPQDIEWAKEGKQFYIVQTRPITTIDHQAKQKRTQEPQYKASENKPLLKGIAASPGIAVGRAIKIKSAKEIKKIKKGDILITRMTSPDFVPAMRLAAAIVTDEGGQTSHAAIVSREIGIPCVVGTREATKKIKNKMLLMVDGTDGKIFLAQEKDLKIFKKSQKEKTIATPLKTASRLKTATKVYVNLGEPSLAQEVAEKNVDGVGLLRAEFMFAQIGTHPRLLIKQKKEEKLINELSSGIAQFCQAFYPRPVVYRTNDFKTNEYRHLKGGEKFEKEEENPLLGLRGASRYLVDDEVLRLEAEAIKIVRNKKKLKNLWIMLPFVRTPKELREVKKLLLSYGLMRSPSLKLWLMVEIPANVVLLEKFAQVGIDGVSLGTNDLTMLMLGVDRDNPRVASNYKETNPAVLWAIEKTIKTCQKLGLTSSMCGQAPSNHPALLKKLVRWGITSVSVNPDVIEKTRLLIAKAEKEFITKKKVK